MKVVVNEQLGIQEIEIIINCSSKDETVQKIVSSLSVIDMKLTCRKDDEIFQLDPANIFRFDVLVIFHWSSRFNLLLFCFV